MSSNIYTAGLRNDGSYKVSGQPFVKRVVVGKNREVKVEFPYVTKNVTVRIPSPPNTGMNNLGSDAFNRRFRTAPNDGNTGTAGVYTLGASNNFSFSFWLAPTDTSQFFLDFTKNGSVGNGIRFMISPSNPIYTLQDKATSTNHSTGTLSGARADFRHFVITYDGSTTLFYVNGSLESLSNGTLAFPDFDDILFPTNMAAGNKGAAIWDEMVMWDACLDSTQVAELYNNGEYFNPTHHTEKDNILTWFTFGDVIGDDPKNLINDASPPDQDLFGLFGNATGNVFTSGPYVSQTTGKVRITPARSLIGAIFYPDSDGDNLVDQNLTIPYSRDYKTTQLTISFWFRTTGVDTALRRFFGWMLSPNSSGVGNQIRIKQETTTDAKWRVALVNTVSANDSFQAPVFDGNWHLFTMTINPDTSKINIYIDSVEKFDETISDYANANGAGESVINWQIPRGGAPSPAGKSGCQEWSDITLWSKALTQSEINELYMAGGYATDPSTISAGADLLNWYKFDPDLTPADNSTTVFDRAGSADATIEGSPVNSSYIQGPPNDRIYPNNHYYDLQGYNSSISLPMKTKEIYLSGINSQTTVEVIAELTNIPTGSMYALTGSGIDE